MSRFSDRLYDVIRNQISDDDAVAVWNHYAERNSYEQIYSMDEFNDLLQTETRSYADVVRNLNNYFDTHAHYLYMHEATGKWTSLETPFHLIDSALLTREIIQDGGYDGVAEISDLFDGYLFNSDMASAIEELPLDEVKKSLIALDIDPDEYAEPLAEILPSVLLDSLEEIYNDDDHKDIYLMPEPVQNVFWGLKEAGMDYVRDNIGRVGPLEPKKALEIAGFDHVKKDIYRYPYSDRTEFFNIKIKGNKIADVKKADREQIEEAVR